MTNNSYLIISGIADFRAEEVLEAAKDFEVVDSATLDNWTCFVLVKKSKITQ
jgi:ribosomal protein L11 methylase PrmA